MRAESRTTACDEDSFPCGREHGEGRRNGGVRGAVVGLCVVWERHVVV